MKFHLDSKAAPYLSHLTLKLNAKASSSVDRATAWSVSDFDSKTSGMLIIGYTMSSGSGLSGKMVVCGSCLLPAYSKEHDSSSEQLRPSGLRFGYSAMIQEKDTIIAGTVMKNLVKVSDEKDNRTLKYHSRSHIILTESVPPLDKSIWHATKSDSNLPQWWK